MNGNQRRLRESLVISGREQTKCSEMDESVGYRAKHGLTAIRPLTIQELARVLKASPTETTSADSSGGDDGRGREQ